MYNTIIIEDDPMVMDINCSYLKKHDNINVVRTFRNGKDAFDFITAGNIVDLIILDIYMPEMDGIEFLEKLRGSGNTCSVIPVTAANERDNVNKITNYNVIDYLVKPFGEKRLHQAIDKFVEYRELTKKEPLVSQEELDILFNSGSVKGEKKYEKPIDPRTLDIIVEYMKSHKGKAIPIKDITKEVGLTSVTVRRYLKHLEKQGVIRTKLDYLTGGKPAVLYICD